MPISDISGQWNVSWADRCSHSSWQAKLPWISSEKPLRFILELCVCACVLLGNLHMERTYTKILWWSLCETCTMDNYHHIVIRSFGVFCQVLVSMWRMLCLWLGNSLGGGLAACLALQRPGFFKGAALLQLTGVQLCTTVDGWNPEILGILPNDC